MINDTLQRFNSLTQQGRPALVNPTALAQAPGMGSPVGIAAGAPVGYSTTPSQGSPNEQMSRYPAPPPPMMDRSSGGYGQSPQQQNYFPTAPSSTPQLPMMSGGGSGAQQQSQSIGEEFGPLLQALKQVADKYPEVEDLITQSAGSLMSAMNKLSAQFSQNGIPRSLV